MRTLTIQLSASPGAMSNGRPPIGADHSAGNSMCGTSDAREVPRFETRSTALTVAAGEAWITAVSRAPIVTACAEAERHPAKTRAMSARRATRRVTARSELELVLGREHGIVASVRENDRLVGTGGKGIELEALAE
jgi:hypothetical protein